MMKSSKSSHHLWPIHSTSHPECIGRGAGRGWRNVMLIHPLPLPPLFLFIPPTPPGVTRHFSPPPHKSRPLPSRPIQSILLSHFPPIPNPFQSIQSIPYPHQKMSVEPQSPSLEQLPKMPSDIQTEVAQKAGLKHVETLEKNVLPTKEDLVEERKHENLKKGIQEFDKSQQLRHVEAEEKVVLPSSQDIASEKAPKLAAEFDKSGLRHVEPNVKTSVEVIDKGTE